ncbi:MAG: DNA adenine methylase, partial [Clostridia bacterium]|nr:DNA adenine methylase [Clostridia bacterium]
MISTNQSDLFGVVTENPAFLTEQIITYIGNKRALLDFIGQAISLVKQELKREKLKLFDVFSGSGIVSRFFKQHAETLYSNDLESYSCLINECYLANRSDVDTAALQNTLKELQKKIKANLHDGFIAELYSPKDEKNIQRGERVFFTRRNAQYIDTARQEIAKLPADEQKFFLAPLLYGASVHNNTSGVFKGFYKNRDGIGQFGGTGKNALLRILGDIKLQMPVFSNFDCDCHILKEDATTAAGKITEEVDLAYLDPPYNQHPYGSNYFMLNLILNYQRPTDISKVSGIPTDWNHSLYNQKQKAQNALFDLVKTLKAKYVLISYNSDGFVKFDEFVDFLSGIGDLHTIPFLAKTDWQSFTDALREIRYDGDLTLEADGFLKGMPDEILPVAANLMART